MRKLLLLALCAWVVGCNTTSTTATIATPQPVQVEIKGFLFKPSSREVPVGTTVIWTNADDINHSVTQGTPPTPAPSGFDSDFFVLNETYSFTFDAPGDYMYFCKRHNHMTGVIQVTP